jgi:hypothetical protein
VQLPQDARADQLLAEVPAVNLPLEWHQLRIGPWRPLIPGWPVSSQCTPHRRARDGQLAADRTNTHPLRVQVPNRRPRFHAKQPAGPPRERWSTRARLPERLGLVSDARWVLFQASSGPSSAGALPTSERPVNGNPYADSGPFADFRPVALVATDAEHARWAWERGLRHPPAGVTRLPDPATASACHAYQEPSAGGTQYQVVLVACRQANVAFGVSIAGTPELATPELASRLAGLMAQRVRATAQCCEDWLSQRLDVACNAWPVTRQDRPR